jgi:hypothetical protein
MQKAKNTDKSTDSLVEQMFTAGAHYGYSKTRRHPSVATYIYATKNNGDIIDLEQTVTLLAQATEFIRLHVNGVTDMQRGGVFEAVIQPGSEFVETWVPDDTDGDFFKIDRAFEFNDGGGRSADPMPRLELYTTPDLANGGTMKKTEKYRWTWLKRAFDTAHDFTSLFALVDALNAPSPEPYTTHTEGILDVEQTMAMFAFEHIINNFDSWGHTIGKNMYHYKPLNGKWQLYAFDLDWLMLVSVGGPGNYTATTGPLFASEDPTVTRM